MLISKLHRVFQHLFIQPTTSRKKIHLDVLDIERKEIFLAVAADLYPITSSPSAGNSSGEGIK